MVRAFATYFNAVNLAERVHRIRRRRDYQRDGDTPQPGGLLATLHALRAEGVDYDTLRDQLDALCVELVFMPFSDWISLRAWLALVLTVCCDSVRI